MLQLKTKKILHLFCILFTCTLSPNLLFAGQENIIFDALGPVVIPNCIIQDSYGFIWIGAQEGLLRYDGYKFKRFNQIPFDSTSLSNNFVTSIKEDKKGNLWIGTWGGGLNYFDQNTESFTRYLYKTKGNNVLNSLKLHNIIINSDSSLWLGTEDPGLIHMSFDDSGKVIYKTFNLSRNPNPQPRSGQNCVFSLYKDKRGNLWVGTSLGGLKLLDPQSGKIRHFEHDPNNPGSISSNTISSICEDKFGNIWVGTGHLMWPHGGGLNKLDPSTGQFKHYQHNPDDPSSISSNNISSLLIDKCDNLWIGTVDNYLNSISLSKVLSSQKPNFTHYNNFNRNGITSINEDRYGDVWISLFGRTVHKYSHQQNPFIWYRQQKGNPNSIKSSAGMIQADNSGHIWFGGKGGVLDRLNPQTGKCTHYYYDPDNPWGLNSSIYTSICEDKYGYYWIGTDNGLNRLNPETGRFRHIKKDPGNPYGLRSNVVNEVLTSQTGDIWVASYQSGLQLYDLDEDRFYYFDLDTNSKKDEANSGIYEDDSGILWSQTDDYGFYSLRIDDHKISGIDHYLHNPSDRNSLSYNQINDLIRPEIIDTSALWIATGNGLNRLDLKTKTFKHYYTKDGLPSNFILKVLEDDEGNIWCSCAEGIAVYDLKSREIRSYGKGDGLPVYEFGSRTQNACKTPDGQLIFGAAIGALGFYPDQLKKNTRIPPVRMTDFKIFNKSVKMDTAIQFTENIELTHAQNIFGFEFAALDFTNPNKNQYAYKMEGLHHDWIDLGHQRTVNFTDLDPGRYLFRVKGSNNHGIWNEQGAAIQVIIKPPWWRTVWAYIAYTLLFAAALVAIVRIEIRRRQRKIDIQLQKERQSRKLQEAEHRARIAELQRKAADAKREQEKGQIRVRISSDLHDEIGSNLSSIAILGDRLKRRLNLNPKDKHQLAKIPEIARRTADSIRDIVWFVNPENDNTKKLIAKMRDTVYTLLPHAKIDFGTNILHSGTIGDLNFRRNLFLIFKETLHNISRHAHASEVNIQLSHEDKCIKLEIEDNGIGFDTEEKHDGSGLRNMKRRAADMNARLEMYSKENVGSKMTLIIKIP